MCGAYGFSVKDAREVYERFDISGRLFEFSPRYNTRPGAMLPVVYMSADGVQIKNMYWTFLPSWAKEKRLKFSTSNARDDRLMESIYKVAVPHQRCIIPATHFFEPDRVHFPKPQQAPWYCFKLKGQEIMGIAGLYNDWTDPNTNEKLSTYTIITTKPNAVVGRYHEREPAMLQNRHDEKQWLNPDITEPEQVLSLLKPYPPEQMESWRAPDTARNPRNDYPELIKPVDN